MKIKDLIEFRAFQGAEFVDYTTHEKIIDQEKEIKDIHSIHINVEMMNKYLAPHHWLTVFLILKEVDNV